MYINVGSTVLDVHLVMKIQQARENSRIVALQFQTMPQQQSILYRIHVDFSHWYRHDSRNRKKKVKKKKEKRGGIEHA